MHKPEQVKYDVQINILQNRIDAMERYIIAGNPDRAFQIVDSLEKQLGPPLDYLVPFSYLIIYLEQEKVENIEKNLEEVVAFTEARELGIFQFFLEFAKGKLHELRSEYDHAIQQYERVLDLQPASKSMHFQMGRCYRLKKDYKKAEDHMQEILAIHPFWPEEVYELGLVYADWGGNDKALEYLRKAQNIWERPILATNPP